MLVALTDYEEATPPATWLWDLTKNLTFHPEQMFVTECSVSTPFSTTEKRSYDRFYIMLCSNTTVLLRSITVDDRVKYSTLINSHTKKQN